MVEFWFIYGYDKVFFHGLLMVYLWLRKGLFPCWMIYVPNLRRPQREPRNRGGGGGAGEWGEGRIGVLVEGGPRGMGGGA